MESFNEKAWKIISSVPRGRVTTYREIAMAIGKPGASRAVGNACSTNPNAPKVPCHRVVKSNGEIGGYKFGIERKRWLLAKEGTKSKGSKIELFGKKLYRFPGIQ